MPTRPRAQRSRVAACRSPRPRAFGLVTPDFNFRVRRAMVARVPPPCGHNGPARLPLHNKVLSYRRCIRPCEHHATFRGRGRAAHRPPPPAPPATSLALGASTPIAAIASTGRVRKAGTFPTTFSPRQPPAVMHRAGAAVHAMSMRMRRFARSKNPGARAPHNQTPMNDER